MIKTFVGYESIRNFKISKRNIRINDKIYMHPKIDWIDENISYVITDNFFAERIKTDYPKIKDNMFFYCYGFFRICINGEKFILYKRLSSLKYLEENKKWWQIFKKEKETSLYKKLKPYFNTEISKEELEKFIEVEEITSCIKKLYNEFITFEKENK